MLLIHTGEINSGKSSRLASLVRQKISEGTTVNGWLTLPHIIVPSPLMGEGQGEGDAPSPLNPPPPPNDRRTGIDGGGDQRKNTYFYGKKSGHNFIPIIDSKFGEPVPFARESAFSNSVRIGKFFLNGDVFDRDVPKIPLKGLFVIDEVGLLEMNEHKGFYKYLEEIFSTTHEQIVIVQQRALDAFLKEFARFEPNYRL